VSEGQLRRYLALARKMPGRTGDNLLAVLERRLDNVVFRMGFAPTIPAARQLVSHGNVRVNGKKVDRPSYLAESGDEVAVAPGKTRERVSIMEAVERGPQLRLPSYIAMDPSDKFFSAAQP
jgi:small subunit ribosomal protein S4